MATEKYMIFINGKVVAQTVPLEYAMVFIRAIFEEYNDRYNMEIMIKEMPQQIDEDEIWERNTMM